MTGKRQPAVVGFHGGELAVQRQAGVQAKAAQLSRMLGPGKLCESMATFFADATFAAINAREQAGQLWISPLPGQPGFLNAAGPTRLTIHSALPDQDPLHGLPDGQPIGLIAVDFAARRRVRINGTLTSTYNGDLVVDVQQAYGNCPQHIQQPHLTAESISTAGRPNVQWHEVLAPEDIQLIRLADTFFFGTTHPELGNDASHRGGPPGFVRADGGGLWWPDYPGNNIFNSFGNLAVDPTAALLFVDFPTERTLHLSGTAAVQWGAPGAAGDDGHTGGRALFTPKRVAAGRLFVASEIGHDPDPGHPPLTDN
ncbi:MAG TPA: pyridoxamine 5'-phosphate oxidase family protein [Mycobacterium sp.]|nr:pyridoxamine 5'-phosphate oxidase family protein [Mycobacterium sp.]